MTIVKGTRDQALRYLLMRVQDDRENERPDRWDWGTETLDDIEQIGKDYYYASAQYTDYHTDYAICTIENPIDLSEMTCLADIENRTFNHTKDNDDEEDKI